MDFLDYWDTRIDANNRLFDDNPGIANFAHDEAMHLFDVMSARLAEVEAQRDGLKEAVRWERECDECGEWLSLAWWENDALDQDEIADLYDCARAAVDALVGEG